jgi:hypothetical protein
VPFAPGQRGEGFAVPNRRPIILYEGRLLALPLSLGLAGDHRAWLLGGLPLLAPTDASADQNGTQQHRPEAG